MSKLACARIFVATSALLLTPASASPLAEPLRFFNGTTISESKVQILFRKSFTSRSVGRGKINPDGSLDLVQRVEESGRAPFERRWHIKRVGPKRFVGTMSEATGGVAIEEIRDRYRFQFTMKGNLKVEQWLTPQSGGRSALSETTIRKHGIVVGRSKGTIRKVA
jgi:hypothetical protein